MNHTRRLRRATQFLILSLIIGGTLRADEPAAYEWKVGLAAAKITPDGPI